MCFEIWTWWPALNLSVLYYSAIKTDICITLNINSFILIIMQIILLFTSTNSGSLSIHTFFDTVLVFQWIVLQLLIFLLYELNNFYNYYLGNLISLNFYNKVTLPSTHVCYQQIFCVVYSLILSLLFDIIFKRNSPYLFKSVTHNKKEPLDYIFSIILY